MVLVERKISIPPRQVNEWRELNEKGWHDL